MTSLSLPPLPFYREAAFLKWTLALWRRYSWRSDYSVRLDPSVQTAYVIPALRVVVVNPTRDAPQRPWLVRHLPIHQHDLNLAITENRLAHEAAHVLYSAEKPDGLLGQLWNMLEDERIERLMARRHPHLDALFTLKRDLYAEASQDSWTGDVLEGVLFWRFTHTHPRRQWQPAPDQLDLWADVRPLVEAAWKAPDSDRVTWIARQILTLCGRDEQAGEDDSLPSSGDDTQATQVEPGTPPGTGAGSGPGEMVPAPPAPEVLTPEAAALLAQVEGGARALAPLLAPQGRPARTQASRDRGRYRYDRHQAGGERPFDTRTPGAPGRVADLRLLVDLSGSMRSVMPTVRALMLTVERASRLAGSPLSILGFDHRIFELRSAEDAFIPSANRLVNARADGGTDLAPALERSLAQAVGGHGVTVIITDGALTGSDITACQALRAAHTRMTYFPILIGAQSSAADYQALFGRVIALERPEDLPSYLKAYLRA